MRSFSTVFTSLGVKESNTASCDEAKEQCRYCCMVGWLEYSCHNNFGACLSVSGKFDSVHVTQEFHLSFVFYLNKVNEVKATTKIMWLFIHPEHALLTTKSMEQRTLHCPHSPRHCFPVHHRSTHSVLQFHFQKLC